MAIRTVCLLTVVVLSLAADQPGSTPPKKELAELQGAWKLVAAEIDGKAIDPLDDFPRWFIKGDKVRYGGEELAVLVIDGTTTPRSLDLGFLNPKKVYEAVYSVEGDMLKVCVNRMTEGVKERPLDFATEGKPDRRLLVFKRDRAGAAEGPEGPGFVGIAIRADDQKGIVIMQALEGSPAKKAGLKQDDVVVRVGGAEATDLRTTVRLVRQVKAGSEVTFLIRRGGKEQEITVKAGVVPFYLLD